jgi:NAD(P)-dependent dehydrogenase (short-subunit alcohol dehydrogenase family)
MTPPLGGRTAVVSGASRGIGLAVARALVAAGARVTMLARGAAELQARAAELHADAVPCDVGDAEGLERVVALLHERLSGAPDILVNSAGFFQLAAVADTATADFRRALDVNLVAPFVLARNFATAMRARGRGDIVSIGSVADHTILPENGAYAASKYALRALHEVLRSELRGSGVRVTLVSPGPVDTPLWDPIEPERREGFTPRAEMLPPEGVAAAVLFALTQPAEIDVELIRLSRS